MAISRSLHRVVRVALLLVIAGGIGLAMHRLRRSPEQVELTRYVERDVPPLLDEEQVLADALDGLMGEKKLAAIPARKRLVEDLTPRLIRLHRRAEALSPSTVTVRQLAAEYLLVVDAWTEAARAAVRAIDDPKLSTEAGLLSVRERLAESAQAHEVWRVHLVETCEHHHLAAPGRSGGR